MNYDFTTVMDRRGHDLLATDVIPHEGVTVREGVTAIPMWIADMSFPTAPAVTEAIEERLRFPNFGYFSQSKEYYRAIIDWHRKRKQTENGSFCMRPPMWASPMCWRTWVAPRSTAA